MASRLLRNSLRRFSTVNSAASSPVSGVSSSIAGPSSQITGASPTLIGSSSSLVGNSSSSQARASSLAGVSPSFSSETSVPEILTLESQLRREQLDIFPEDSAGAGAVLDLSDGERLFAAVPTLELLRACGILYAAAIGPMVDLGSFVMRSKLMDVAATRAAVLGLVRHTFYEHFCAGEGALEAARRVRRLHEATGLKGMLVYGVEHADDNVECDKNLQKFLETVEAAKSLPSACLSSVVVKITAICPISLLKRVSNLLRWQYKNPNFDLPWKRNTFQIFSDSSPLYHTNAEPEPLSAQEIQDLESAHERLLTICQRSKESRVALLIDAEDTFLQPAIDYFSYSSAIVFNTNDEHPVVYNTIQAYLKDAGERLRLASEGAKKEGVGMGFKIVRGAYMSSENKLANSMGRSSPIHDTIEETHACYNNCVSYLLEKVADGSNTGVVLATHNIDSGKLAAKKASELSIDRADKRVEFAQLYGMSDALSFGLRNIGFNVSKYMPFGPIGEAIPYLLRRAEENRGMLAASSLDRDLMRKELKRRVAAGVL